MAIERAPFDLHALMARLAALFEPSQARALHFTKSVSVDTPYLLVGDDVRIQQVLINLAANALSSPSEASSESASAHSSTAMRSEPALRGARHRDRHSAEHAGRIFERFTRPILPSTASTADRAWAPRSASTWSS